MTTSSSTSGGGAPAAPQVTEVSPAGDIPDTQAFVAVTADSGLYKLTVPEGWARTSAGASSMTFTDKLNLITVEQSKTADAPTVDTVKQSLVPTLESTRQKFQLTDVSTFTRPGGDGVLVTFLDDSAANAVTGTVVREEVELYLFWKNGQQVALTLNSSQGSDNVDPWNIVTKSFTWLP
ncbi:MULTISPECIES: hypothetical protein [unclassified Cryobacterium]|uniref:hypothetical protein n=1 Tax=unclassified Cryobacterium TaxID=2649013 RepID=UPI0018CA7CC3|nr:hypothetical protein [Cryobacterium sp. CAN_C3]